MLSLDRAKLVLLSAFASAVIGVHANSTAWAWGNQGHEIVAIIAADNLSPSAREQVTRILGTASDTGSLEKAMAAASVRPDTEFREGVHGSATHPRQDENEVRSRCTGAIKVMVFIGTSSPWEV